MSSIIVTGFVVGLLPLRMSRSADVCRRSRHTLHAHRDFGMPDGRDFMALLLCSHAAVNGRKEVVARAPMTPASLLRVAGLRIELDEDGHKRQILVAQSWQNGRVRLSSEFIARCASSSRGELPLHKLRGHPPGVIATAMAIVTMRAKSIGLSDLMQQLGSRTRSQSSGRQQFHRRLRILRDLGIGQWFYDAGRDVIFERAEVAIEWVGRRLEGWTAGRTSDNSFSQEGHREVQPAHRDRGNSS